MQKITPFLMFNDQAEEAMNFYVSVFKDSKIVSTMAGPDGNVMGGSFGRAQASLQYGKQVGNWSTYLAAEGAHDSGYRRAAASDIRRVYGDIGYKGEAAEFHLSGGLASNIGASRSRRTPFARPTVTPPW